MSESKEHKRRYNLRLMYIAKFDKWLAEEPKRIFFYRWHRWKKCRPVWDEKACLGEGRKDNERIK